MTLIDEIEREPPTWYAVDEIRDWLNRQRYDDLAVFLTEHLQKSFEKGYNMRSERIAALVELIKENELQNTRL